MSVSAVSLSLYVRAQGVHVSWNAVLVFDGMLGCVLTHHFAEFAVLRTKLPWAVCLSGSAPSAVRRSRSPLCPAHKCINTIIRVVFYYSEMCCSLHFVTFDAAFITQTDFTLWLEWPLNN